MSVTRSATDDPLDGGIARVVVEEDAPWGGKKPSYAPGREHIGELAERRRLERKAAREGRA